MIPLICPRDCPDRRADPNCHTTCRQYAELRAICDRAADERLRDQLVRSYVIETQNNKKAFIREKRSRLKSITHGRKR